MPLTRDRMLGWYERRAVMEVDKWRALWIDTGDPRAKANFHTALRCMMKVTRGRI